MTLQISDEEFSEFVHGAWPGLYRTAYLLLGDAGLAEDLVQTALAKTYAAWPSVRDVRAENFLPHPVDYVDPPAPYVVNTCPRNRPRARRRDQP